MNNFTNFEDRKLMRQSYYYYDWKSREKGSIIWLFQESKIEPFWYWWEGKYEHKGEKEISGMEWIGFEGRNLISNLSSWKKKSEFSKETKLSLPFIIRQSNSLTRLPYKR